VGKRKDQTIAKEVERSMKAGAALVQASIEHLDTAERSWDKHVREGGIKITAYPSAKQVLTYMVTMSRERQRMCLAQRGKRRKGRQKGVVKKYVSEMANNLWATKYPAFGKLAPLEQKEYWGQIFGGYKAMYAAASAPAATEEDEERAEQLLAQTEEVYKRKHFYRTEMQQLQDLLISEGVSVNQALIFHAALAVMQSTAARVGMLTKTRHDEQSVHPSPFRPPVLGPTDSCEGFCAGARRRVSRESASLAASPLRPDCTARQVT